MKRLSPTFCLILFVGISTARAQQQGEVGAVANSQAVGASSSPAGAGSEESVRVTPYTFTDGKYGASVSVFESVPESLKPGAPRRLYLSPLCTIAPFDAFGKKYQVEKLGPDKNIVSLRMVYYHDGLYFEAAQRLNSLHGTNYRTDQISLLPVSLMTYKLSDIPGAKAAPKGEVGARIQLANDEILHFELTDSELETLKKLANGPAGLSIATTYFYNGLNLSKSTLSWSLDDVRNTGAYKKLDTQGSNYVQANQVKDIVQEIGRKLNVIQYEDPDAESVLDQKAMDIFYKLLEGSTQLVVNTAAKAAEADEALRSGTGLDAKNFMPVQLDFQYATEILSQTKVSDANQKADEFFKKRETQLSVSAKGSYGPVSGRASYNEQNKQLEHKKFSSQSEFDDYKSLHYSENGKGVRFEPRGINLVEKGTFNSRLSLLASAVRIKPVSSLQKNLVYSSTAQKSSIAKPNEDRRIKRVRIYLAGKASNPDMSELRLNETDGYVNVFFKFRMEGTATDSVFVKIPGATKLFSVTEVKERALENHASPFVPDDPNYYSVHTSLTNPEQTNVEKFIPEDSFRLTLNSLDMNSKKVYVLFFDVVYN